MVVSKVRGKTAYRACQEPHNITISNLFYISLLFDFFFNVKLKHYTGTLYNSLKFWGFFCFQDGILLLVRFKSAGA